MESMGKPTTLEEFVTLTLPRVSEATYQTVSEYLEPQRGYVEGHLKMYHPVQESWKTFAQGIWNAFPETVKFRVNELVVAGKSK